MNTINTTGRGKGGKGLGKGGTSKNHHKNCNYVQESGDNNRRVYNFNFPCRANFL